jgi:hypothetical protein
MQLTLCVLFYQGIDDLMHDNKTEHLRTINILERFNIYQEVILAVLYKLSPFRVSTITCVACTVVVVKTHIYMVRPDTTVQGGLLVPTYHEIK